ncbi:DUF5996 family protein [Flavobacterium sp. KBS0721]|uniref:DUF5996 family protein n=1 Tax=Flavobacterium sp. KBS0721 TaxID=1179672 RepID=UPI00210FB3B0|nr:DUF5996 family protein [Flavobacterium sp. KBS0721]
MLQCLGLTIPGGVTLHLTPAGLTTQTIPYNSKYFQIDFDLNNHQLEITTSLPESKQFSLENISVAGFYQSIQKKLKEIDIEVPIFTVPSEIVDPIPFEQDESHNTYDKEHASALHIALLRINEVFLTYRSDFKGKTSPIHFFFGEDSICHCLSFPEKKRQLIQVRCQECPTGCFRMLFRRSF